MNGLLQNYQIDSQNPWIFCRGSIAFVQDAQFYPIEM